MDMKTWTCASIFEKRGGSSFISRRARSSTLNPKVDRNVFQEFLRIFRDCMRKWLGKIKPDVIIEKDGTVRQTQAGGIQPFPRVRRSEAILRSGHPEAERVSIVILTFNQLKYTQKCIESILGCTPEAHEIIFVDNASTDGTVKWLREMVKNHANCKLIRNDENRGFAAGNNQGMAEAKGDYIVLMNNDVVVTAKWLERLIACAEKKPEIGMVGPMSNHVSGPQWVKEVSYDTASLSSLAQFSERLCQGTQWPDEAVLEGGRFLHADQAGGHRHDRRS